MNKSNKIILLSIATYFALSFLSVCSADVAQEMDVSALIHELQQGGYIIYLRHAATDHSQVDLADYNFNDCSTQRNLSKKGRAQARGIAEAIKILNIPIDRVLSSPFCRCIQTATLAFNKVEVSQDLRFAIKANEEDEKNLAQTLIKMLATKPQDNSNTVLVSHTGNLKSAAQLWPKPEGVAFIFKPLGDMQFLFMGKILPNQWRQYVNDSGVEH